MSRRTQTDPGFGSDSFLDIIANIVGILIILIVVAGVKVARQPVVVTENIPAEITTNPEVSGRALAAGNALAETVPEPARLRQTDARKLEASGTGGDARKLEASGTGGDARKLEASGTGEDARKLEASGTGEDARKLEASGTGEDARKLEASGTGQEETIAANGTDPPSVPDTEIFDRAVWMRPPDDPNRAPVMSAPVPVRVISIDKDLVALKAQLASSTRRLDEELEKSAADLEDAKQKHAALADAARQSAEQRKKLEAESAAMAQQSKDQQNVLRSLNDELAKQIENLRLAEGPVAKITNLRHKLTPIGREVTGDELHFRIEHGRISHVPIDRMLADLKRHLRSQARVLARQNRHTGRIGPIDGYYLRFVVERERFSIVNDLRYGAGTVRIGLSEWRLQPSETVLEESLDQALGPKSNFGIVVRAAPRDSTMTFWVYPDSFSEFSAIREFVQEHGHTVAARPLPTGTPIAGSPKGTRSVAQ